MAQLYKKVGDEIREVTAEKDQIKLMLAAGYVFDKSGVAAEVVETPEDLDLDLDGEDEDQDEDKEDETEDEDE